MRFSFTGLMGRTFKLCHFVKHFPAFIKFVCSMSLWNRVYAMAGLELKVECARAFSRFVPSIISFGCINLSTSMQTSLLRTMEVSAGNWPSSFNLMPWVNAVKPSFPIAVKSMQATEYRRSSSRISPATSTDFGTTRCPAGCLPSNVKWMLDTWRNRPSALGHMETEFSRISITCNNRFHASECHPREARRAHPT